MRPMNSFPHIEAEIERVEDATERARQKHNLDYLNRFGSLPKQIVIECYKTKSGAHADVRMWDSDWAHARSCEADAEYYADAVANALNVSEDLLYALCCAKEIQLNKDDEAERKGKEVLRAGYRTCVPMFSKYKSVTDDLKALYKSEQYTLHDYGTLTILNRRPIRK
jgi:hypothetical protein